MTKKTIVNINFFPLVTIIFSEKYNRDHELDDLIKQLDSVYQKAQNENKKFCLLLDTRKIEYANPALAVKLIKWLLSKKELSTKYLICTCLLITNSTINSLLSSVLSLFKPTRPHFVTDQESLWYIYPMIMTIYSEKRRNKIKRNK